MGAKGIDGVGCHTSLVLAGFIFVRFLIYWRDEMARSDLVIGNQIFYRMNQRIVSIMEGKKERIRHTAISILQSSTIY